jgi:hypothetical protein
MVKWTNFTNWVTTFEGIVFLLIIFVFIIILVTNMKGRGSVEQFTSNVIEPPIKRKRRKKGRSYEGRIRNILQKIFNKPFPSIRPDWLKNPETGRNLEIDCYNDDIQTKLGKGLAIEVDGAQHFQMTSYFHNSPKDFINQVKRDRLKDKLCDDRGVLLIRVPYFVMTESDDRIEEFIRLKLKESLIDI